MSKAHASALECAKATGEGYAVGSTGDMALLPAGGHVAIIGHPIFSDPALQSQAQLEGPAAAMAVLYQSHGEALASQVDGHFSYAVVDARNACLHAGIDRLGIYPLYVAQLADGVVWGTDARTVLAHPEINASLASQALYDYVFFHMIPAPGSVYIGLQKLPAAHRLSWSEGQLSIQRYWLPDFNPPGRRRKPGKQDQEDLRRHLKAAVGRCLEQRPEHDRRRTGAFLSGGLDSSSVVGMLAECVGGKSTHAFAIGFDAKGYDEMPFARITAAHFGATLHEYYVTPNDVVEALPLIAASYDEPFGNSSALPAYFCARFAREQGMDALLAGDGGDELFAGNERYAKQLLFERYLELPTALRKGLVEPLTQLLPAGTGLGSKARSFLEQAATPLPERLHTYNFLNQFRAEELFTPKMLARINQDAPMANQRSVYQAPAGTALDRMLYLDWQFTLADNDLRKVSQMCAMAGMDVRYPMLDADLRMFSCGIADGEKLRRGDLRHFYKQALTGWLPDETISKKKQGFGLPFGVWLREHPPLAEIAREAIEALRGRDILRPEFLNNALELQQRGHAAYYGELVWVLTMLELWLQHHDQ
ncbi:asparagine synthetase B family protein [Chromatocurvus halotolerans]|nr:asparagine synthase-related protein [Chromatocurvus halotolerans]